MPTITTKQLEARLLEIRGAQALTFTAETDARLYLTDNPFICPHCGESIVVKRATVNGIVNVNYAAAVERQRRRERGEPVERRGRPRKTDRPFVPLIRTWGERVADTPLVEYRGRLYLNLKRERILTVEYRLHGRPATAAELAIIEPLTRRRVSESKRQQLDHQITWRDYTLGNVLFVRMRGQELDIRRPRRRQRLANKQPITKRAAA